MSLRSNSPKARLPDTHFFITFARGEKARCLAVRVPVLWSLAIVAPLAAAAYLGATLYLIFRDDMLSSLMSRQAEMQYAYEDRLAGMRAQLDRVTSRQLLEQDSFEGKVNDLLTRQAKLETRATVVAALADQISQGDVTGSTSHPTAAPKAARAPNPLLAAPPVGGPAPASALGFAPVDGAARPEKPRPEAFELRTSREPDEAAPAAVAVLDAPAPETLPAQIFAVSTTLDRIERQQIDAMARLEKPAASAAARLRQAYAEAGLAPDRLTAPKNAAANAMGGPFVPLKVDANGSPFERGVARLQDAVQSAVRMRALLPYVPLRKPLPGAEVTSSFGTRVDPFFGRAALHGGIDFREEVGAPIRAAAAGTVVSSGPNGGYGVMVEIDHGNGLSTRYAHMSSASVSEGQTVQAGAILGKVGSTGRSTGPHLHYEVRVDDDAVDPARFLRAGARLYGKDG